MLLVLAWAIISAPQESRKSTWRTSPTVWQPYFMATSPKMTYDEAKAEIQKFFTELQAKQEEANKKVAEMNSQAA